MSSQSSPSVAMRRIPSQPDYSSEDSKRQSTPGAKRRPSKAGKRSVTTLTAAQLERKRANDREAQRAIRQRTKDHIDQLERQIADLTSNQDNNSKLVEVLRRNDELESENAVLKSRLNHAFSALGYTEAAVTEAPSPVNTKPAIIVTPRSASASTARSAPSVAASQHSSIAQQHEHWHPPGYHSPAASEPMEVSTSMGAEPATAQETMPWGQHAQHLPTQPQQLGAMPMPMNAAGMHAVEAAPQGHMNYYMLDPNGRPMAYPQTSQSMAYATTSQPPPPPPQPQEYPAPHHQHPHAAEYQHQGPMNVQIPGGPQYPQYHNSQGYMPATSRPSLQVIPRGPVDNQQMMYHSPH